MKKGKEIELRPKFKLKESDYKRMLKAASLTRVSMSEYVRLAVMHYIKGEIK